MGSDRSSKRDRDHDSSKSSSRRKAEDGRGKYVDGDDGKTREDYDRERERKKSRRARDEDDYDRGDRNVDRDRRDHDHSDPYARRRDDDDGGYSRSSGRDRDRDRDHHGRRDRDRGGYERRDDRGYSRYDDDRRGGRGGGGQNGAWDWRGMASRGMDDRRSLTPEGTRPISERVRGHNKWDVHAEGFEKVSAAEAKMSGVFGLTGQARGFGMSAPALMMGSDGKPVVGVPPALPPIRLGQGGHAPAGLPGVQLPSRPNETSSGPQGDRQSRRLYVGNIGNDATEQTMTSFFNAKLRELNLVDTSLEGEPCIAAQVARDKGYAFIEFRSIDECTNATGFDGIIYQGLAIKIRRPKDYTGPDTAPPKRAHVPGVVSTNVPDGPNKIYVGSIPTYLNEEQVMELLKAFGELRAFNLVKESGTGASKGFGFCEYVDPNLTDIACQGLNDMELGDRKLIVQRASTGTDKRPLPAGTGANAGPLGNSLPSAVASLGDGFAGAGGDAGAPTKAMVLLNMVTPEELSDDAEYGEIVEDIRDECARYGQVVDVRIPRPLALSKGSAAQTWKRTVDGEVQLEEGQEEVKPKEREGVGRVYVRFNEVGQCESALKAIAGRQFGGRLVIAAYLDESSWPGEEDGGHNADDVNAQATGPKPEQGNGQIEQQEDDGGEADMVDSD